MLLSKRTKIEQKPARIEVVNVRNERLGVLEMLGRRLPENGARLKVYGERRSDEQLIVYLIDTKTSRVCHANMANGNFKVGDILRVETAR